MRRGWYVLRTRARAESLAARELKHQGLQVFLPRFKSVHSKGDTSETPLFPGYLFLRCDPEKNGWPLLEHARHLLGWVTFGDERPRLSDYAFAELIEKTKIIKLQDGFLNRFAIGDKVSFKVGEFVGVGNLKSNQEASHPYARVRCSFMGRLVETQVPWIFLQPVVGDGPDQFHKNSSRRTRGNGRLVKGASVN